MVFPGPEIWIHNNTGCDAQVQHTPQSFPTPYHFGAEHCHKIYHEIASDGRDDMPLLIKAHHGGAASLGCKQPFHLTLLQVDALGTLPLSECCPSPSSQILT